LVAGIEIVSVHKSSVLLDMSDCTC